MAHTGGAGLGDGAVHGVCGRVGLHPHQALGAYAGLPRGTRPLRRLGLHCRFRLRERSENIVVSFCAAAAKIPMLTMRMSPADKHTAPNNVATLHPSAEDTRDIVVSFCAATTTCPILAT